VRLVGIIYQNSNVMLKHWVISHVPKNLLRFIFHLTVWSSCTWYIKIQSLHYRKHCVPITKTNQLVSFREMSVHSAKRQYVLCGKEVRIVTAVLGRVKYFESMFIDAILYLYLIVCVCVCMCECVHACMPMFQETLHPHVCLQKGNFKALINYVGILNYTTPV
jgi:hypothetical protein